MLLCCSRLRLVVKVKLVSDRLEAYRTGKKALGVLNVSLLEPNLVDIVVEQIEAVCREEGWPVKNVCALCGHNTLPR